MVLGSRYGVVNEEVIVRCFKVWSKLGDEGIGCVFGMWLRVLGRSIIMFK